VLYESLTGCNKPVRTISPGGIISALHSIIKDLTKYKGLDVVDVEVGDIQIKVSLK
jgi:hypothetical protein